MMDKEYFRLKEIIIQTFKGGEGSGNFGHAGRPGEVGGSAGDSGELSDKPSLHTNSRAVNWILDKVRFFGVEEDTRTPGNKYKLFAFNGRLPVGMKRELNNYVYTKSNDYKVSGGFGRNTIFYNNGAELTIGGLSMRLEDQPVEITYTEPIS